MIDFMRIMHASIACIMSTKNGIDTYDTTQRISSFETSKKHTHMVVPYGMVLPSFFDHHHIIIIPIFVMTSLPNS
jgi:hypothetical protein